MNERITTSFVLCFVLFCMHVGIIMQGFKRMEGACAFVVNVLASRMRYRCMCMIRCMRTFRVMYRCICMWISLYHSFATLITTKTNTCSHFRHVPQRRIARACKIKHTRNRTCTRTHTHTRSHARARPHICAVSGRPRQKGG